MDRSLKVAIAAFYTVATILMAGTFYRSWNGSWLYAGHASALYVVSVVLPVLWIRTLVTRLTARGVVIADLQWAILMPAWCAVVTALIALQLARL